MNAWTIEVPTYYRPQKRADGKLKSEGFATPCVPIVVHEECGVRIALGACDWRQRNTPDIQIERRPNGWAIFVRTGDIDPCALLFILDDARTVCVPQRYAFDPLEISRCAPPEVDDY